ncbi:ROK family protein [Salibacterium halotolerans]|uniref:fructokinase n=1 Tax=Salibacterium halotolerans TaxID=1884432 RepID=A0A1I5XB52_9BACI|nr:ROK family protein [Salibacterium halotolerans]SFQ29209.1 fructokinase [Salibacterium halotolerans]
MYYGAIEAGGTKFVCAVSRGGAGIEARTSIPTTTPEETLKHVFAFFDSYTLTSMGIGSFGPIDVNTDSDTYGSITSTPKPGWGFFDFLGEIKDRYNVPTAWTTDVNASAYGEFRAGEAEKSGSCVYLTVGTGIGGGAVVDGKVLEGFGHPEMGHILVRRHPDDKYEGNCPYHADCLEGMAAGPAIEKRHGQTGDRLAADEKVWEIEAYYLAQALVQYTLILRPEVFILGGGVMKQTQLFPLIRQEYKRLLNSYVDTPDPETMITAPALGDDAAVTGCLLLAAEAKA